MDTQKNPTDHSRTTQPRAGEWFKDPRDVPGPVLIAIGVLAVVFCLAAAANGYAAYGYTGWAISMGLVAILVGTAGAAWLLVEDRRLRRVEAERSSGQAENSSKDRSGGGEADLP